MFNFSDFSNKHGILISSIMLEYCDLFASLESHLHTLMILKSLQNQTVKYKKLFKKKKEFSGKFSLINKIYLKLVLIKKLNKLNFKGKIAINWL